MCAQCSEMPDMMCKLALFVHKVRGNSQSTLSAGGVLG